MKKIISILLILVTLTLVLSSCNDNNSFEKMTKEECWSQLKENGAVLPDNHKDELLEKVYNYAISFEKDLDDGSFNLIAISSILQEELVAYAYAYLAVYSYYDKTPSDKDSVELLIQNKATLYEDYCNN